MADIANIYKADGSRYENMQYNRVGRSGLMFGSDWSIQAVTDKGEYFNCGAYNFHGGRAEGD